MLPNKTIIDSNAAKGASSCCISYYRHCSRSPSRRKTMQSVFRSFLGNDKDQGKTQGKIDPRRCNLERPLLLAIGRQ